MICSACMYKYNFGKGQMPLFDLTFKNSGLSSELKIFIVVAFGPYYCTTYDCL